MRSLSAHYHLCLIPDNARLEIRLPRRHRRRPRRHHSVEPAVGPRPHYGRAVARITRLRVDERVKKGKKGENVLEDVKMCTFMMPYLI